MLKKICPEREIMSALKRLALCKQGLLSQQFGSGLIGTRDVIEHLGYVQIDTLSVIERAHHHVLWNRVPNYDLTHLNQLIKKRHIFEYWYHAASYLPMRDYRYALPNMSSIRNGENRYFTNVDNHLMKKILTRICAEGPTRLRDLESNNRLLKKSKSWSWGPTKRALDKLFMQGDVMVCERNGMEKVYGVAENCLPKDIDLSVPTLDEYAEYLFNTMLRSHGVFTLKQLIHLKTGKPMRDAMRAVVNERIDTGIISIVKKEGAPDLFYDVNELEKRPSMNLDTVKILSPFDNAIIHRDRLSALFGFDYRLECYVPASKRVYGYFCLPILYGEKLVGRIDCKAHRSDQRFEVLSMSLEDDSPNQEQLFPALMDELQRFSDFNGCSFLDASIITV